MLRLSEQIAREFAEKVREKVPGQTSEIYLYGSRARGDDRPDSDYDILIVVDRKSSELEDQVMDVAAELLNAYDALIAATLCPADIFERFKEVGLFRTIQREGIRL